MKYKLIAAIIVLLLILAGSIALLVREKPLPPPTRPEPTPVVVYEIQPVSIRDQIILSGTAIPWQQIRLSAEIGGRVVEVAQRPDNPDGKRELREGDRVATGELLFAVDTTAMEADLRASQAAADYAMQTFQRYTVLHQRDVASDEEFQRWRAQAEQAQQAVNAALSRLDRAQVRSPMDGIIDRKFVDQGTNVTPGEPLGQIVSIDRLKVVIAVPENAVQHVSEGDEMNLSFDVLPDAEQVVGRVIFVAATADDATLTFPVHLEVDNTDRRLRAGNIAKVHLVRRVNPQAVAVPLPALMSGVTGYRVMVVEDGIARSRQVELMAMDRGLFEIRSGLQMGDMLIVQGQREAVDGRPVDVRTTVRDLNELPQILLRAYQQATAAPGTNQTEPYNQAAPQSAPTDLGNAADAEGTRQTNQPPTTGQGQDGTRESE